MMTAIQTNNQLETNELPIPEFSAFWYISHWRLENIFSNETSLPVPESYSTYQDFKYNNQK